MLLLPSYVHEQEDFCHMRNHHKERIFTEFRDEVGCERMERTISITAEGVAACLGRIDGFVAVFRVEALFKALF